MVGLAEAQARGQRFLTRDPSSGQVSSSIVTCREAYTALNAQWAGLIDGMGTVFGRQLYPNQTAALAKAKLFADLPVAYQYLAGVSANATDIAPSPDGRWVAFQERWHLYVMPFARTGRPIDIGPRVTGVPVAQISRDAGFFLHWSGDSQSVHWMLGPEFFTRRPERA